MKYFKRPVLSAILAFFLLSLTGIPFTGGFFGKFYVFSAAIHSGHVWLGDHRPRQPPALPASTTWKLLAALLRTRPVHRLNPSPRPGAALCIPPPASALAATVLLARLRILPGQTLHLAQRAPTPTCQAKINASTAALSTVPQALRAVVRGVESHAGLPIDWRFPHG